MKLLISFWNFLNGKKIIIATIFWSVTMPCLNIIYPNGIPSTLNKTTLIIGTILSVLGIGHKIAKNYMDDTSDQPAQPDASVQGK